MAYIGNTPADKYQTLQKQSFTTSATDTYTLSYAVTNPQDLALFINNVRQNPNDAYTVSGTTLTLSSAITGSDTMYAVFLGRAVETVAPALSSVTNDMLAGSIATSKLADGSTFATTNGITQTDQWRISANYNIPSSAAVISSNLERNDNTTFGYIGSGMSESSGTFTFPTTGLYLVKFNASRIRALSGDFNCTAMIIGVGYGAGNNTLAEGSESVNANSSISFGSITIETFFNCTNTSTHQIQFWIGGGNGTSNQLLLGDSTANANSFTFIRMGDSI